MPRRSPVAVAPRPEVLAFLQAIKENPEDDGPRMMLADWLEERGDPRGSFVRLQCDLVREPVGGDQWKRLHEESKELEREHGLDWLGPMRREGSRWEHQRGLLHARFRGQRFLYQQVRAWAETEAWAWVERLRIESFQGASLAKFATSQLLPSVPHLELSLYRSLRPEGMTALVTAPFLARLATLHLHVNIDDGLRRFGEGMVQGGTSALPAIRALSLEGGLTQEGVQALASGLQHTRLTAFSLKLFPLEPDVLTTLVASPQIASRITSLKLHSVQITQKGLNALVSSPYLTRLTTLELVNNSLDDAGAVALAHSPYLATLTSLNLLGNQIGDRGAKALAKSPHLANLRSLSLYSNPIGNVGARTLATSLYLKNLVKLLVWNDDFNTRTRRLLDERFGR